jgi:hypothetical protein
MPIYYFENNQLAKTDVTTFSSEGILERSHLQAALKEQIEKLHSGGGCASDLLIFDHSFQNSVFQNDSSTTRTSLPTDLGMI